MTRRGKITVFLVVAAMAAGGVVWALWSSEPRYQGKPLSRWIREVDNVWVDGRFTFPVTKEQREALRAMGEPAVKRLIVTLQTHDSKFKSNFVEFSKRHTMLYMRVVVSGAVEPEIVYRARAAMALGEIGPAARDAIPALSDAANDPRLSIAEPAAAALMKIRGESVTNLFPALDDTNDTNWYRTAATVVFMGPDEMAAARPLFVRAAQSSNVVASNTAAYYLKYFYPTNAGAK